MNSADELFSILQQQGSGLVTQSAVVGFGGLEDVVKREFEIDPIDKSVFIDRIEKVLEASGLMKEEIIEKIKSKTEQDTPKQNIIPNSTKSESIKTSTGIPSRRSSLASVKSFAEMQIAPETPKTPKAAISQPVPLSPSPQVIQPSLPIITDLVERDAKTREQSVAQLDRGVSQARESDVSMEIQFLVMREEVRRDVIINGETHDRKRFVYQKWETCGVPLSASPHSPIATSIGLGRTWDLEWTERVTRRSLEPFEECERSEIILRKRLFLRWADEFSVIAKVARPMWTPTHTTPPRYRSTRWTEESNVISSPPLSGLMLAALSASPATVRASSFSYNQSSQLIDNNSVLSINQSPFAPSTWNTYEAPEPPVRAMSPPRRRKIPFLFNEVASKLSVGTMSRIADGIEPPSTMTTHRWC